MQQLCSNGCGSAVQQLRFPVVLRSAPLPRRVPRTAEAFRSQDSRDLDEESGCIDRLVQIVSAVFEGSVRCESGLEPLIAVER